MKKMKRIEAIIKGRKITEALFGLRKKTDSPRLGSRL